MSSVAAWLLAPLLAFGVQPALAARLRDAGQATEPGSDEAPRIAILGALGRLGGSAEVQAVAEVARDVSREQVALHALATLVKIGTPEAVAAIDAILRPLTPAWRVSFRPPAPDAPRPQLLKDQSVRVAVAGGRFLVIFPDPMLGDGFRDLWAAETDASGKAIAPARFLGQVGSPNVCPLPCRTTARLEGRKLTLRYGERGQHVSTVDWDAAARDSDGDGLSDIVEQRLAPWRSCPGTRQLWTGSPLKSVTW